MEKLYDVSLKTENFSPVITFYANRSQNKIVKTISLTHWQTDTTRANKVQNWTSVTFTLGGAANSLTGASALLWRSSVESRERRAARLGKSAGKRSGSVRSAATLWPAVRERLRIAWKFLKDLCSKRLCGERKKETSSLTMEKHKGMTSIIYTLHDTSKHERGREKVKCHWR